MYGMLSFTSVCRGIIAVFTKVKLENWEVVARAFNSSNWEAEGGGSL